MQLIIIPAATILCGECYCQVYYNNESSVSRTNGDRIVKCINPECKNKGKLVKVPAQIIEVEECVQQEAGNISKL